MHPSVHGSAVYKPWKQLRMDKDVVHTHSGILPTLKKE